LFSSSSFFVGLGFKLKNWHVGNRHSTSSPFCSGYFGDGGLTNYLPWLASNYEPPNFSLPNS
jgi:hypothetical protein